MSFKKFQFIQQDFKNLFEKSDVNALSNLKNKTVFITGCAGFVGLWICEIINYLNTAHNYNVSVFGIDIQFDRMKNEAPHLMNIKQFTFKQNDVRYFSDIPKETNYIIHCAGQPDHRFHSTNPVDVLTTIANGTENILKAADRLSELLMFVNLSSALAYGHFESRNEPIQETEALILKSNSPYVSAKIYSESMTQSYRQQYRLPTLNLRPFTFIGPFQTLTSPWAVNNFINDALSGSAIKVLGTGETVRSFLYGSDVAFWILNICLRGESGETFNIGSSEAVALKTVAEIVNSNLNISKEILYCSGEVSSQKKSYMVSNNQSVESKFNLKSTKSIEECIRRTMDWYMI